MGLARLKSLTRGPLGTIYYRSWAVINGGRDRD
jgi:hypothetical protein